MATLKKSTKQHQEPTKSKDQAHHVSARAKRRHQDAEELAELALKSANPVCMCVWKKRLLK